MSCQTKKSFLWRKPLWKIERGALESNWKYTNIVVETLNQQHQNDTVAVRYNGQGIEPNYQSILSQVVFDHQLDWNKRLHLFFTTYKFFMHETTGHSFKT